VAPLDEPRAYRPLADPREQRKNLLIAVALVVAIVAVVLGRRYLSAVASEPVEVVVSGADGVHIEAAVEVLDGAGREAARGRSDPATGVLRLALPAGAYRLTATVNVRETDQGLPNAYPSTRQILVREGAGGPQTFDVHFPTITLHPWKAGQYSIKR
jgi:hypothetical protein